MVPSVACRDEVGVRLPQVKHNPLVPLNLKRRISNIPNEPIQGEGHGSIADSTCVGSSIAESWFLVAGLSTNLRENT